MGRYPTRYLLSHIYVYRVTVADNAIGYICPWQRTANFIPQACVAIMAWVYHPILSRFNHSWLYPPF